MLVLSCYCLRVRASTPTHLSNTPASSSSAAPALRFSSDCIRVHVETSMEQHEKEEEESQQHEETVRWRLDTQATADGTAAGQQSSAPGW